MIVRVPERGHVDISQAAFSALAADARFWQLVDRKVLSVSQASSGRTRLSGSCYVGRCSIAAIQLELHEKVSGALAAMLGYSTRESFRLHDSPAPASDLGALAALLVRQFLDVVSTYLARGRDREYRPIRSSGSLVGGRLDMTRSIGLRARGLRHILVFDRNVLVYGTAVNRVVLAALREVEVISKLVDLPDIDVMTARTLSLMFSDCLDEGVVFAGRRNFMNLATLASAGPAGARYGDMLALASVILSHESFEASSPHFGVVPRSWFLNLETLFENAVRRVLRRIGAPHLSVERGSDLSRRIFGSITNEYSANPDLVLKSGGLVCAIGDVKYKTLDGLPGAADVYQLLAHASAFGTDIAFLVFPTDAFCVMDLGQSSTGCRTYVVGVDVTHLERDLRQALSAVFPSGLSS